jgi:exodeoxyribonuclease VII small subunit
MSEEKQSGDALGFSEAMSELEGILKGVEDEEIDIDILGKELGRAAVLLELCRDKIRRAEVEVTQIVQSLQTDSGVGETEPLQDATQESADEQPEAPEVSDELPF